MLNHFEANRRSPDFQARPASRSALFCTILCVYFILLGATSFAQNGPTQDEAFRMELLDYFSNLEANSPTVFGKLAENPAALASIRERVLDLNPEELHAMRERFAQAPYWQVAPEMLFSTLSPDLRSSISSSADAVAGDAAELESFRGELAALQVMLEIARPELAANLGIDSEAVAAFGEIVDTSSPQQLNILRKRMQNDSNWIAFSRDLTSSLDAGTKEAIAASIATRNLDKEDREELQLFRDELVSLIVGFQMVPEEEIEGLDQQVMHQSIQTIQSMSPEMLYLLRAKVRKDPVMNVLTENVHNNLSSATRGELVNLSKLGPIDESARASLNEFRTDLADYYQQTRASGYGKDSISDAAFTQLQKFTPAQTALLRQRLEKVPGWQAIPSFGSALEVLQTMPAEQLISSIENADPLELERIRASLNESLPSAEVNHNRTEAAQRIRELSNAQLAVMGQILSLAPASSRADMTVLLASSAAGLPNSGTGVAALTGCAMSSNFGIDVCYMVSHPSPFPTISCPINIPVPNVGCLIQEFTAVGTSITDLTTQVGDIISQLPSVVSGMATILPQIADVAAKMPSVFSQVAHMVATQLPGMLTNITNSFGTLSNLVSSGINGLPTAVFNTLAGLVNNILTNSGLPLNAQSLIAFLQLNNLGNLIASLPPLPDLPCPEEGTPLASFGDVGELETLLKYQQYQFVYETLGEIIPDNEYTAALEIPIQLVSASIGYIGQCLEAAAERADNAEQGEFMEEVAGRFDSLDEYLAEQFGLLDDNLAAKHLELTTQLSSVENNLSTQSAGVEQNLTNSVNNTQNVLNTSITVATTTLSDGLDEQNQFLDEFQTLMVRLKIERDMLETPKEGIGLFLLPETMGGYLETVRDIVLETIQMWDSLGQDMKSASKEFLKGEDDYAVGSYKTAYDHYRKAYELAVKK